MTEMRESNNSGHRVLIGRSPATRRVLDQIELAARDSRPVLLVGEIGVGTSLAASMIHALSSRRNKRLVRLDCGAESPESLTRDAFMQALAGIPRPEIGRVGRLGPTTGSTLVLNRVSELRPDLQRALLDFLTAEASSQSTEAVRRRPRVRVLATTTESLLTESQAGRFLAELYYRLSVFTIPIPPLRDRREDILPLAEHFLAEAGRDLGVTGLCLNGRDSGELAAYDWPGNARELRLVIERAALLARARGGPLRLGPDEPGLASPGPAAGRAAPAALGDDLSLRGLKTQERDILRAALERSGGKVYGSDGAAALLRLRPTTLVSKLKRFGLSARRTARRRAPAAGGVVVPEMDVSLL